MGLLKTAGRPTRGKGLAELRPSDTLNLVYTARAGERARELEMQHRSNGRFFVFCFNFLLFGYTNGIRIRVLNLVQLYTFSMTPGVVLFQKA